MFANQIHLLRFCTAIGSVVNFISALVITPLWALLGFLCVCNVLMFWQLMRMIPTDNS